MTLTKSDIINSIYNSTDLKLHQATKTVDNLLELIKKTLGSGEDILISGFGKFYIQNKNDRRGRNPETGSDMMLGARRVVRFRCSGKLKEKLNTKKKKQKKRK
ncbi:MAG: integration host factor subunit alpha [Candidatus Aminicenantes bacterium]|nr:integration host factor subunit alpha [Candidatus Aminicenantes bacterium]